MEELPYALLSHCGGITGFPKPYQGIVQQHFRVVYYAEFLKNKHDFADKIQLVLVWWHKPHVDKGLLQSLPNLKVVSSGGVGVDHLDLQLISSFGVKVTNTPHVGNDPTADMGMALMLAAAKLIVQGSEIVSAMETQQFDHNVLVDDITEATLGIVGMGSIGYSVALRAHSFRMKIVYHNRRRRKEEEEKTVDATYCENIEDLLRQSDFVMLAVILTPETHKLIGENELRQMKPTATLINISRGKVVDQDALVEALQNGTIKAAALDVTYPEPLPRGHPLLTMKNVIVTPHVGNATDKTRRKVVERLVSNSVAVIRGLSVPDEITIEKLSC
ncbi:glyoxylate/hydroxypyruvate reductase B-like [Ambystoma mexicanum]|uniref:glyoxylate/hydroxypyruvate reductase B-like n=1 Tax=Ambystoma mexicanum TaxID=8296 RepID=UPI0037E74C2F